MRVPGLTASRQDLGVCLSLLDEWMVYLTAHDHRGCTGACKFSLLQLCPFASRRVWDLGGKCECVCVRCFLSFCAFAVAAATLWLVSKAQFALRMLSMCATHPARFLAVTFSRVSTAFPLLLRESSLWLELDVPGSNIYLSGK